MGESNVEENDRSSRYNVAEINDERIRVVSVTPRFVRSSMRTAIMTRSNTLAVVDNDTGGKCELSIRGVREAQRFDVGHRNAWFGGSLEQYGEDALRCRN